MLAQVAILFLIGLCLGALLPYLPCTSLSAAMVTAIALSILERRRVLTPARGLLLYGSLLAGVVYWTLDARSHIHGTTKSHVEFESGRITGRVVEPVRHAPNRMLLVLAPPGAATGRVRVSWREPDRTFHQGEQVELSARIRPPTGLLNPGGFDHAAYLAHRGVRGVASVTGPGKISLEATPAPWSWWGFWRTVDRWRDHVRQAAVATLLEPALGIFLGMVIGEAGYLTPEVRDAFMATGTVHILSISGSHLGLIAFLSFLLVKAACRILPAGWLLALSRRIIPTRLAAALTALPLSFYTLLAGSEIATVRSLVMILIFLLAVWLGRRQHLVTALAAAALLILIHDPHALFDISFQLSYSSVLAIALVILWDRQEEAETAGTERRGWPRMRAWMRQYGRITVGVTLATLPLVAYHFNQIAWLGLVGNAVVVPLAGFVLVPLSLGAAVWALLAGASSLPGGPVLERLYDLMLQAMEALARVPGAEWHVASPGFVAALVFYLLLLGAARPSDLTWARAACAVGLCALVGWWGWAPRPKGDGETIRVTFLDVGQGDASVIELPDGKTVVIDAGAAYDTLDMGRAVVAPFLWDRGIRRVDQIIASHPQLDHVGGLPALLRAFPVGRYWGSGTPRDEPFYQRLQHALARAGLAEERAEEGRVLLSAGACRLEALNPPRESPDGVPSPAAGSLSGKHLNNQSVVVRLDCGGHSFLFTGDAEAAALVRMSAQGAATPVEILKVPHHGSKGSLMEAWIQQVRPEVAVISVGRQNAYGHPAPAVLNAYAAHGARLLRTDREGAVWITARLSSPSLIVRSAREFAPLPVRPGPGALAAEGRNLARLWALARGGAAD